MRIKIYASDEGYGPLIRQSAIIEELRALKEGMRFTLQTQKHVDTIQWITKDVEILSKSNNISWARDDSGNPDLEKISNAFLDYDERSYGFIHMEQSAFNYDCVISDFVPEAFYIAKNQEKPAFGVCHFTWDWFFSKLYPIPLNLKLIQRFQRYAKMADVLFFPPFTPKEILNYYKNKIMNVPFIVRKRKQLDFDFSVCKGRTKALIMDSGSGVLRNHIRESLSQLQNLCDFYFFMSSKYRFESSNISFINDSSLFTDYIPYMDLVIARAGFNTISECIAYRTPMLLISEELNPEMHENIVNIKKIGLGSFISEHEFKHNLVKYLPKFMANEYNNLLDNMKSHDYKVNGARVIAENILNRIMR